MPSHWELATGDFLKTRLLTSGYPTSVADQVTRRDFFACFKLESENFKLPPPPDVVGYFGGTGNILLAIPISGPCYGGLA